MKKKGFTLVELLAVIAILAILVIIALPNVLKMFNNAKKNSFLTEAKTLYSEVTNKYITESMKGNKLTYVSSEDSTKLELSGRELKYCVQLNSDGSVDSMEVTDGTYIAKLSSGEKITDLKAEDVPDGYEFSCTGSSSKTVLPAKTFGEDTWQTIASNASNCVSDPDSCPYKVEDTKTVDLGTYGKHTVRIANLSTPSECSTNGFSQSACGFVVEFADIITTHNMNSSLTNVGGWPASAMYKFLNDESDSNSIINALPNKSPNDLKSIIIDTKTVSGHGSTSGETNFTSTDKLYLLTLKEIYSDSDSLYKSDTTTRQLDYYSIKGVTISNHAEAIKKNGTTASNWWLRCPGSSDLFYIVDASGTSWSDDANRSYNGISPAFRIG